MEPLGPFWGDLKAILATLGASWGASWGFLGASWGASWGNLGASWASLGFLGGQDPPNIFPLGSLGPLGPSFWEDVCAVLDGFSIIISSCFETPQSKKTAIFILPEALDRTPMTGRIDEFAGLSRH